MSVLAIHKFIRARVYARGVIFGGNLSYLSPAGGENEKKKKMNVVGMDERATGVCKFSS